MKELILKWLEKLSCKHELELKYEKKDVWSDYKDEITLVFICKKCGKIRKIKI